MMTILICAALPFLDNVALEAELKAAREATATLEAARSSATLPLVNQYD